jgi:hypothetical protein
MLTRPVNVPTGRPPSPHIRARNTSPDGTANGSAGVNSAPDVDAGVNSATHLGRQLMKIPATAPNIESLPSIDRYLPNTCSTAFMTGTLKFFSSLQ